MNFWQIAAGEGTRDYAEVFTKFGVMFVGPGDPGPFQENRDKYASPPFIASFAESVALDDIVILKRPYKRRWEIVAVGCVTGEYEHLDLFSDVEGWDLQHCRKVDWRLPNDRTFVQGLTRGTLKRLHLEALKDMAIQILEAGSSAKAAPLPAPPRKISDEELVERLVDSGLRPADAETVIQTIWRVRRLARWYRDHGKHVGEHETRTFLIVPVILALGWSEQKIKIEWKNLDVAFFREIYGHKNNPCIMILESKRMWEGLSYATSQIENYAKKFPECSRLVVSDGICYRLYEKKDDSWKWTAYLNLLKLRDRHPYHKNIDGASDVFVSLMPK